MYLRYFGLAEKPFAITPDPRYLYLGSHHADALAHLAYGIKEAGGFIQLTGEVGTGKTTTIRSLLARAPENADIALIINPRMSPLEFLQTICEEFGLGLGDDAGDNKAVIDQLNRYLLKVHAAGRRAVLIVDEAQGLTPEVLEQVRLLTNLETVSQKLLQIILIGQPELRDLLRRDDLRQLAQRVTARFHLDPLERDEAQAYVRHRLRVAGATRELFTAGALRELFRVSGGVPRVINVIADRALLGAYTSDQHEISAALVRRAADEVFDQHTAPRWLAPVVAVATLLAVAGAAFALVRYGPWRSAADATTPAAAAPGLPSTPGAAGAPVTVPDPPRIANLGALLADATILTSADVAFGELFRLWGAGYQLNQVDACEQALAQGLECVSMRGSLAQLNAFNRPAILLLGTSGATPRQAVLRTLGDNEAELRFGDRQATVSIADLAALWYGDFVLLWKPEPAPFQPLSVGMRGAAVLALRTRLQRATGTAALANPGSVFDQSLQTELRRFQEQHGVDADGVAGLETQLLLDGALAAAGTPQLRTTASISLSSAPAAVAGE